MTYTFEEFNNEKELWDKINYEGFSSFLTLYDWIEFQKSIGKNTKRFWIKKDDEVVGTLYIEIFRRKIAKYAYSPHSPVLLEKVIENDLENFLIDLSVFAKSFIKAQGLNYFKIDTLLRDEKIKSLEKTGWKKSFSPGQAKDMWVIDFKENEEKTLMSFKKDTRYYVRRAEKLGVEIVEATSEEEVREFVNILNETKERKGFQNFNDSYFIDQWKALNVDLKTKDIKPITRVFLAKFEGKTIAGALINYNETTIFYSHGGSTSDPELSKLAAPYFLHWTIIKNAIEHGYSQYSMWGVVPKGIDHVWRSMSNFKMKFPGEIMSFSGTYEVCNNTPMYYLNRLFDYYVYRNDRY